VYLPNGVIGDCCCVSAANMRRHTLCCMFIKSCWLCCPACAAELRRCSSLRELHLESNRLVTPLLDLTHATALESLQVSQHTLCALLHQTVCTSLQEQLQVDSIPYIMPLPLVATAAP
jgi:hypothetical protein